MLYAAYHTGWANDLAFDSLHFSSFISSLTVKLTGHFRAFSSLFLCPVELFLPPQTLPKIMRPLAQHPLHGEKAEGIEQTHDLRYAWSWPRWKSPEKLNLVGLERRLGPRHSSNSEGRRYQRPHECQTKKERYKMRTGPGWEKKNLASWLAWPHLLMSFHKFLEKSSEANSKQAALSFRPKRISIVAVMHTPMKPGKNNVWAFVIQYPNLWYNRGDSCPSLPQVFQEAYHKSPQKFLLLEWTGENVPFKILSLNFLGYASLMQTTRPDPHDCGVSIYWYYIRLQYQIIWWTQNLNLHPGSRRKGTPTP